MTRASSKFPRTGTTRAPWMSACASFPVATWPSGMTTAQINPARAAYAAADAEVLPVEAQITALAPSSTAFDIASVIPRSLNDPVGLSPSSLSSTRAPVRSERRGASTSGVPPSNNVTTGVAALTGKWSR